MHAWQSVMLIFSTISSLNITWKYHRLYWADISILKIALSGFECDSLNFSFIRYVKFFKGGGGGVFGATRYDFTFIIYLLNWNYVYMLWSCPLLSNASCHARLPHVFHLIQILYIKYVILFHSLIKDISIRLTFALRLTRSVEIGNKYAEQKMNNLNKMLHMHIVYICQQYF